MERRTGSLGGQPAKRGTSFAHQSPSPPQDGIPCFSSNTANRRFPRGNYASSPRGLLQPVSTIRLRAHPDLLSGFTLHRANILCRISALRRGVASIRGIQPDRWTVSTGGISPA